MQGYGAACASLEVLPGAIVSLVGENGLGKGTPMQNIVGLLGRDGGMVTHTGRVGYCPQQPYVERADNTPCVSLRQEALHSAVRRRGYRTASAMSVGCSRPSRISHAMDTRACIRSRTTDATSAGDRDADAASAQPRSLDVSGPSGVIALQRAARRNPLMSDALVRPVPVGPDTPAPRAAPAHAPA